MRRLLQVGLLLVLAVPAGAGHQSTILFKDFTGEQPVAYRIPISFDADELRVDTKGLTDAAGASEMIFRTATRKVWHIDHADKSYLEIDERMASTMTDGVNKALEWLEGMWGEDAEPGGNDAPLVAEHAGQRREIMGVPCERYLIRRGDETVQDIWLASWSACGINEGDFTAVRQLALASDKLLALLAATPGFGGLPALPLASVAGLDGYPIMIRQFGGGRVLYDIILHVPEKQGDRAPYLLPEGYRRRLLY